MEIDGTKYVTDQFGVVRECGKAQAKYDCEYVNSRYNTLPDHGDQMSWLRIGYIIGAIGGIPANCLDVGYGNGSFLRCLARYGVICSGYDVSGYPVPDGCRRAVEGDIFRDWELLSFFDSLEHFWDIGFVVNLRARYVAITAPHYHPYMGEAWFEAWKHRRPGEHLHHFSPQTLRRLMKYVGYQQIITARIEDGLRGGGEGGIQNIFTSVFRRI